MLESRTPRLANFGKLTEVLKTKVSEETKELFDKEARACGMESASELLREMIMVRVYGPEVMRSLYEKRISVASISGTERAPE